ncbi:hypothetical protein GBA52_009068 [Prunus armeniaca]|nr:hypothetical protein GBA52_009068 [Prunus armeniaca]
MLDGGKLTESISGLGKLYALGILDDFVYQRHGPDSCEQVELGTYPFCEW